jgi:hypothetical protein
MYNTKFVNGCLKNKKKEAAGNILTASSLQVVES